MKVSIIDEGNKDFVRFDDGSNEIVLIDCDSIQQAEDWLLDNAHKTNWTNSVTFYYIWDS